MITPAVTLGEANNPVLSVPIRLQVMILLLQETMIPAPLKRLMISPLMLLPSEPVASVIPLPAAVPSSSIVGAGPPAPQDAPSCVDPSIVTCGWIIDGS